MKKHALQNGFNKVILIECIGCQNAYHFKCLQKKKGITMDYLEKHEIKWMCNIKQQCSYLKNPHFIKYGCK